MINLILYLAAVVLTIKGLIAVWAYSLLLALGLLIFASPALTVVGVFTLFQ